MVRSFCSMGSKDKMRYIESTLSVEGGSGRAIPFSILSHLEEGEEIVYETRRHWGTSLPFLAIGLILSPMTHALSLFLVLPSLFQMKTYEYAVTDRRVIAKWGLFKTHVDSIPLEDVRNVVVGENFIGKKLGMGNVRIDSGEKTSEFQYIEDPWAFVFYIDKAKKEKMGASRKATISTPS